MNAEAKAPFNPNLPRSAGCYAPIPGFAPVSRAGADMADRQDLVGTLDRLAATMFEQSSVAGAVASVVHGGEIAASRGYGWADALALRPVDVEHTLFRIGSMSKLVTATAVMQLVERCQLDLDTDVNAYLRGSLAIPRTFPQPVTLKHLLTHTAGFEENQFGWMVKRSEADLVELGNNLAAHIPSRVRPPATDFAAGEASSYSSWAIALAGHIVALQSGMPFDDYVERNIFQPLGMTSSTFREPLPAELLPHVSRGHHRVNARLVPQDFEFFHSVAPSGGMSTTAPDMARFMLAHLPHAGRRRLLQPATVRSMQNRILSPHPRVNGAGLGFYEIHLNGRRALTHRGKTLCFAAKLVLFPDEDLGIFLATNTPVPATSMRAFLEGFMSKYLPADVPPGATSVAPGRASQCAGSYFPQPRSYRKADKFVLLAHRRAFEIRVEALDAHRLVISNLVGPSSRWIELEPGVFRQEHGQEQIAFTRDAQRGDLHLLGPMAFSPARRLALHERPGFHAGLQAIAKVTLVAALTWIGAGWIADPSHAAPVLPIVIAALLVAVSLSALRMIQNDFATPLALLYAYSRRVRVAVALTLISVPLTAAVVGFAVAAWHAAWWTVAARTAYSLIALLALVFLWSLDHWNLVGCSFGELRARIFHEPERRAEP
jgi:CubicO group peptidase (beta-lactamase class C family)